MRIAQICTNAMSGSVGKIARNLSESLVANGHECIVCYARGKEYSSDSSFRFGSKQSIYWHVLNARLFDSDGFHSKGATKDLIKYLESLNPDIIHIHCLHGYYLNYQMLFKYFKDSKKKVVWTMHDCWAYTGHCAFYDFVECSKWKVNCEQCPQKGSYPKSLLLDCSKRNFETKKDAFTSLSVDDLKIVTPSRWLKNEIKKSFLSKYPITVINNDVDLRAFYIDKDVTIEKKILGVANIWDRRKGLNDFIELSKVIPDEYKILIVGASEDQIKKLAEYGIDAIGRTSNIEELANLYRTSTILLNPTYEDNYPTVNVEAISCGLPVVTYKTGGSPEIVENTGMGRIVEKKDFVAVVGYLDEAYKRALDKKPAIENKMVAQYLALYEELIGRHV